MSGRKKQKKKLWLIPVCAAAIAALTAGLLIVRAVRSGEEARQTGGNVSGVTPSADTVIWEGKEYRYNDHLSNYLILGIDTREKAETSVGQADAGQADALYLLSWDSVEKTVSVVTIPRDTMTEIEAFGPGGESLGKSEDHISLSFAFGDGGHESCRLTEEAVSNLFYDLPIQGYCAVNLDGIPVLTESVGTLTVTVPNDSMEEAYPEFAEGAQITLDKENTELFVRYRDTDTPQSALDRTERQKEYIRAFGQEVQERFAGDAAFAADLYTALEPYMVTSMGNDEFVRLMESAAAGSVAGNWTVPGEGVQGKSYDEYHVDDDALYAKILETFYKETESGERGETP